MVVVTKVVGAVITGDIVVSSGNVVVISVVGTVVTGEVVVSVGLEVSDGSAGIVDSLGMIFEGSLESELVGF
jgi:hypothetical protein